MPITTPLPENWRGFFVGVSAFTQGLRLVAPGGGLFAYAIAPAIVSLIVLVGGAIAAWAVVHYWFSGLVASQGWPDWLSWVGSVVALALAVFIAYFLFMPVMQLFAPLFLDPICERVYEQYTGRKLAELKAPFWKRQANAIFLALKMAVAGLLIELPLALFALFSGIGAIIAAPIRGWLQGGDLLDNPLSIRQVRVRDRYKMFSRYKWAVSGLGTATDLSLLVPGLNLLSLAAGTAGATLLLIATEAPIAQSEPGASAPGPTGASALSALPLTQQALKAP